MLREVEGMVDPIFVCPAWGSWWNIQEIQIEFSDHFFSGIIFVTVILVVIMIILFYN
jgi:hypothetical protein